MLLLNKKAQTCLFIHESHQCIAKVILYILWVFTRWLYRNKHTHTHNTVSHNHWIPYLNAPPWTLGYSLSCAFFSPFIPFCLTYLSGEFQPRISSSEKPFRTSQDPVGCLFQIDVISVGPWPLPWWKCPIDCPLEGVPCSLMGLPLSAGWWLDKEQILEPDAVNPYTC